MPPGNQIVAPNKSKASKLQLSRHAGFEKLQPTKKSRCQRHRDPTNQQIHKSTNSQINKSTNQNIHNQQLHTLLINLAGLVLGNDALDTLNGVEKVADGSIVIKCINDVSNVLTHIAVDVPLAA